MTSRQKNILDAIMRGYKAARNVKDMGKDYLDGSFEAMLTRANEDKLSRIDDIAYLFFLAMFKFGEE